MRRILGPVAVVLLIAGLLPAHVLAATGPKFTAEPGGATAGTVWAQQPQIAIKTGNNVVESATGTISIAISSGTGAAGAVLTCAATTVTLVNGVATFAGCRIDKAGTGYRLSATWSQGGSDESASFNITGGSGTKLGFTVQPARGTPGVAFAIQASVAIQDAAGTTLPNAPATTVTLAVGANPGGATLTCSGGLSKSTVNGVAVFSGCRLDKVGVGYTVVATAVGLTSAASAQFDVADRLAFTTQPAGATSGIAFTTQPAMAVRAGANATATHDSATVVTLSIKPGTGAPGATLTCSGGLSKTAVNGVATFAGCKIDKASPTSPANPYVLVATASGLTLTESATFAVGSGANLTISNSASVITWASQFTISVRIDQSGASRAVQVQGSRDGANWTAIVSLNTDASGNASYVYAPVTNLYYRAVFAGAPDLGALTSTTTRTVVRQISILRPINRGSTLVQPVALGTTIKFTDTVRPARPELPPATVRFVFYRLATDGVWRLHEQRDLVINSLGQASTTWTFPTTGQWYIRAQARPTPYNANSVWGAIQRFSVR